MIYKFVDKIVSSIPESNRVERIWKLAQVDFKKRYYNDNLGLLWALMNPVFRVLVYYTVFTTVLTRAIEGIENYALFLFSGLVFWQTFMEVARRGITLLRTKKYLIESIRVSKLDLFLSHGLSVLLGFIFNIAILLLVVLVMQQKITIYSLYLPILIFNTLLFGVGAGMILAVIHIYFKDISHITDIAFLIGFWTSGVFFSGEKILEVFPILTYLNPMIGVIINVRKILIEGVTIDAQVFWIDLTVASVVFVIGYYLLTKYSWKFLENI